MSVDYPQLVLYFSLYSFYGWICETAYCSVLDGRLVRRGFLSGPYCPIYGVGALLVIGLCRPLTPCPPLVFLLSMLLASLLEYFTGWLFENFLQMRLWDYSDHRFQLKGRVCLLNSTLFGFLGLAAVYLLHPVNQKLVLLLNPPAQKAAASALLSLFTLDFLRSLKTASGLTGHLQALRQGLDELKSRPAFRAPAGLKKWRQPLEQREAAKTGRPLAEALKALVGPKDASWRLIKNYPGLSPKDLKEEMEILRACWAADQPSRRLVRRKLKAGLDRAGQSIRALTAYEASWIFAVGGLIGFMAESLLHSLAGGSLTLRPGLIYGPLCPVYGLAAVLSFILLRGREGPGLFLGAALLGGLLEYGAGLFLEKFLHLSLWDYRGLPFAVEGRTTLLKMFIFGLTGLAVLNSLGPGLSRLLAQIAPRPRRWVSLALIAVMTLDLSLSGAALWRWAGRSQAQTKASAIEKLIDRAYPDRLMLETYPGLRLKDGRILMKNGNQPRPSENPLSAVT